MANDELYLRALSVLQQLIRIRTHQPNGDELDAVKYIVSLFPEEFLCKNIINHGSNRASLALRVPGKKRSESIAIIGHLDTLGVRGTEGWVHSPFGADFIDGNVYGRGAANMKGGITSSILSLREIVDEGIVPPRDIVFCLTADGDMSGFGAEAVMSGGFLRDASALLFAEPTDCQVVVAQKGVLWVRVKVYGKTGHACVPEKSISAIDVLIKFYQDLKKFLKKSSSHKLLGEATSVLTQLHGGEDVNVVSGYAEGTIDIRTLPSLSNHEIIDHLKAIAARICSSTGALKIEIVIENDRQAVGVDEDSPFVSQLNKAIKTIKINNETRGLIYFTDANRIVPCLGVPFVILGPGKDIYSFPRDEHVAVDSVIEASRMYSKILMMESTY